MDWEYLITVVMTCPALNVHLTRAEHPYGMDCSVVLESLWKRKRVRNILVFDGNSTSDQHRVLVRSSACERAVFSQERAAPCSVLVESLDYARGYTVTQSDMA